MAGTSLRKGSLSLTSSMLSLSTNLAFSVTASRSSFLVRRVVSSPIKMRILSSCCHLPSRSSSEPISKNPVAISNWVAIWHHSSRYLTAVQPEMLLSTMKRSPPLACRLSKLSLAEVFTTRVKPYLLSNNQMFNRYRQSSG